LTGKRISKICHNGFDTYLSRSIRPLEIRFLTESHKIGGIQPEYYFKALVNTDNLIKEMGYKGQITPVFRKVDDIRIEVLEHSSVLLNKIVRTITIPVELKIQEVLRDKKMDY
jgi:hypothetical protein